MSMAKGILPEDFAPDAFLLFAKDVKHARSSLCVGTLIMYDKLHALGRERSRCETCHALSRI